VRRSLLIEFQQSNDVQGQEQEVEEQDGCKSGKRPVRDECNVAEDGERAQQPHVFGDEGRQDKCRRDVASDVGCRSHDLMLPLADAAVDRLKWTLLGRGLKVVDSGA
jgi:hypothetical protein